MFIKTHEGVVINGACIEEIQVSHEDPRENGSMVIAQLTYSDARRTLFRGMPKECEVQLQRYTNTLNTPPIVKVLQDIRKEIEDIQGAIRRR